MKISTHTLTWSVTEVKKVFPEIEIISTHTLTWSVTLIYCTKDAKSNISTHTLTWSVTRGFGVARSQYIHFNSHAHVERDNHWR